MPAIRHMLLPLLIHAALCAAARADEPVAMPPDEALVEAASYRGRDVSSLVITGLPRQLGNDLRKGLALFGRRGLLRHQRAALFGDVLDADIRRARIFLAQRGFPWSEIGIVFEPRPDKKTVDLVFAIAPGPPVQVDALEIRGLPDPLSVGAPPELALKRGARFTEAALEASKTRLEDFVAGAGYPLTRIDTAVDLLDSLRAGVRFEIDSGPRCRFGDIRIDGPPADLERLAERSLPRLYGRLYAPEHLGDSRRNLQELDLFRRIDVGLGAPDDGRIDLVASLQTRKLRSAEFDLGYWSSDFLRVGALWRHRNLLGGGRGVEFRGDVSRFLVQGTFSAWWPALLGPRTRTTFRLQSSREYATTRPANRPKSGPRNGSAAAASCRRD